MSIDAQPPLGIRIKNVQFESDHSKTNLNKLVEVLIVYKFNFNLISIKKQLERVRLSVGENGVWPKSLTEEGRLTNDLTGFQTILQDL